MDREQVEQRMNRVLTQIAQCTQAIRVARHAEGELERLRRELRELAQEYALAEGD